MSRAESSSPAGTCRAAALDVAWSQWQVLGGRVGGRLEAPRSIVDPEALILLSCALRDEEPRLWDLVGGLLTVAPSLLSVQRTKNLAARYPAGVRDVLAEAAAIALRDGKDARWKPLAGAGRPRAHRQRNARDPSQRLEGAPALMLRLRLAFGVNARSDALAFLLAAAPSAATAREAAIATGYGPTPMRRALEAMAAARIVAADGARPERYHADRRRWTALLGAAAIPDWRHWNAVFAFVAAALPLGGVRQVAERSAYLRSSDQRRLATEHRAALTVNRITAPDPADYPGEAYLEGFDATLLSVAAWMRESL